MLQVMKLNIFQHLPLKLIALVLAIIIWVMVVGEQKSEVQYTVPLELRNVPDELEIIERTSQVEVTVRGFSSTLKRLTPGDIDVHIDLSSVVKGPNTFVIQPDEITVPVGVSVIQVSPSNIDVLLDATVRKTLTVEPTLRGTPAAGYALGEIRVEPKNVTVTGAQSVLKGMTKVGTEPIVLDSLTRDVSKKVKVRPSNTTLRIEHNEEKIVSVSVQVVPEMTDRFFENIPLLVKDTKRTYTLSPDAITALVHGPKLKLLRMKPEDIPATIDISDLPDGQSAVQPVFELPGSMSVKIYYPKIITITIRPAE